MMQLDEMARQASTDVRLAVMDLEAPPIGATAKSERKATAGWAKPLFAMAAMFLIAGTSWVLLGGNKDVEETQIADLDADLGEVEVFPLIHPDAIDESIAPFLTTAQVVASGGDSSKASFVYGDSEVGKGFMVTMTDLSEPMTAADLDNPTGDVRGKPTMSDSDGSASVSWLESDTLIVSARGLTMSREELLAELENPNVLEGKSSEDSSYAFLGTTALGDGTADVDGYEVQFRIDDPDLDSLFEVSSFAGSIQTERSFLKLVFGFEAEERQIRGGKEAYVVRFGTENEPGSGLVLWEESPGVVALLSGDVRLDALVQIAEELKSEALGDLVGSATVVPLVHPAGVDQLVEALKPLGPDSDDVEILVFSTDGSEAISADGFMLASIRFAEPFTAEDIADGFPGTEVRGLPTESGEDEQGAFAIWLESDSHLVRSGSQTMTVEELLAELQHPGLLERTVADDSDFAFVGSTRFLPDEAENSAGLTGFTTTFAVSEPELATSTFRVTTFAGSLENELLVSSFGVGAAPAEVELRSGVPAYLFVGDSIGALPQLMWEESPGVVAVLQQFGGIDTVVDGSRLAEIAAQLERDRARDGSSDDFADPTPVTDPTVEIPNERGDARQAGVVPLVPADGEDAIVQELPNPSGSKRVIATWIYYQDGGDGASEDDTPELAVTRVADASPNDLAGEDFSDAILLFDGSVSNYRDGARAVWKDGPDLVIVVGASSTPDELLATIDATPGIGSGEVPEGLERRGGGAKRNPASGSYSFSLDVTGFDAYVGLGVDAFYAVTTYATDGAEELAAHRYLVPEAVSRNIRNGKLSLHSVDEAGDRQQLIWAESEFVIAILETTPDVSVEQMYTWAEDLVPFEASVEDIELTAAEAASPGGQRIEALRESAATKVLLFRLYDEGRAADIFYEVDDGREVCVETIGLDTPVQCFTAEASPPAAYFIRTNADDFDAGERSVLVVMYASDSGSTFSSSDALERSNLTSGMKLIVGALYADDPVVEILDDNGVLLENLALR